MEPKELRTVQGAPVGGSLPSSIGFENQSQILTWVVHGSFTEVDPLLVTL